VIFARKKLIKLSLIWRKSKVTNKVSGKLGRTFHVLSSIEQRKSHILFTLCFEVLCVLETRRCILRNGSLMTVATIENQQCTKRRVVIYLLSGSLMTKCKCIVVRKTLLYECWIRNIITILLSTYVRKTIREIYMTRRIKSIIVRN